MALTPLGKIATIFVDLTQARFDDSTVYGGGELNRNQLGIAIQIVKKDVAGVETDLVFTSNDTDPATDEEWTFTYPEDGWFRVFMFQVTNYSAGTTYSQYEAAYDAATKKFYRSKTDSNTGNAVVDTVNWEELTTPGKDLAAALNKTNESTNLTHIVVDDVLRGYTSKSYGELISAEALLQPQEFEAGESSERYWVISILMEAMSIARSRSLWSNGEKVARRSEEIINQC